LAQGPADLIVRIRWAEIAVRLNRSREVLQWWTEQPPDLTRANLDELLELGSVLANLDQMEDAAAVFYQAHRRHGHDPRAHLGLTSLMLFHANDARWMIAADSTLRAGVAFGLRDDSGVERAYILEDVAEQNLRQDELSTRAGLGARVLGLRPGDSVITHQSELATHQATITWVKHKYVHALHSTLAQFNTRFPDHPAMVGVPMPTSGPPEVRIAPILQESERQLAWRESVAEHYTRQPVPIATIARMLGRDELDVWPMPFGPKGPPVTVCLGNPPERAAALKLLGEPGRRYILEPSAVLTLDTLGLLEPLMRVLGPIAVVQETLELLRQKIAEERSRDAGYLQVGSENGQLVRYEITREQVAHNIEVLERVQSWVSQHCQIVPAVPRADPNTTIGETLRGARGDRAFLAKSAVFDFPVKQ